MSAVENVMKLLLSDGNTGNTEHAPCFIKENTRSHQEKATGNTGNTTTAEGATFTSRFSILGTEASSSAIIELGYDDGVTKHVCARIDMNGLVGGEFSALDGDGNG